MTVPPAVEVLARTITANFHQAPLVTARRTLDALSAAGYVIVNPQDEESMRAAGFMPGLSVPPIDCTNTCMDAECNCSGEWRVMAWKWLAPEPSEP